MTNAPKSRPSRACNSFNVNGDAMNVAIISRQLFWGALDQHDSAGLYKGLAPWVFADDTLRLSMRPTNGVQRRVTAPAHSGYF
jgi:hypothetical protein